MVFYNYLQKYHWRAFVPVRQVLAYLLNPVPICSRNKLLAETLLRINLLVRRFQYIPVLLLLEQLHNIGMADANIFSQIASHKLNVQKAWESLRHHPLRL